MSLKSITLPILFLLGMLVGCQNKVTIAHSQADDTTTVVSLAGSARYLLLPIQDDAPDVPIVMEGREKMFVRLARQRVDYFVPLLIEGVNNASIQIHFLPQDALALTEMTTSNTFDRSNREAFRPAYHFSPDYGWMNDPNGMVYHDGEYHLFYQYNPYGSTWQNMSWGHAVSRDLARWEQLPVVLTPDSLGAIFSGSAIIDYDNVAGFGKEAMIAFYTSAGKRQTQSIAYSTDGGRSFTKYEGNPVLVSDAKDFRDPKVFYHQPSKRWIMVLAVGQEMQFFSSENLRKWTFESSFGHGYGAHGGVWECPDLLQLPVDGQVDKQRWVLIVNINPGGPFGGSATQYFTGDFDGKTFRCETASGVTKWMDYGKDHYATVTWSNAPQGRTLAIGWMSNWQYAQCVPTSQFRSANTVARELFLFSAGQETLLGSAPAPELELLRGKERSFGGFAVKDSYHIESLDEANGGTYELEIEVEAGSAEVFGFKLFNDQAEEMDCYVNIASGAIFMDRSKSGNVAFHNDFAAVTSAPLQAKGRYALRLFVDRSSVELFANGGRAVMTNLVFPSAPYNRLSFYTKGGDCRVVKMNCYPIK